MQWILYEIGCVHVRVSVNVNVFMFAIQPTKGKQNVATIKKMENYARISVTYENGFV